MSKIIDFDNPISFPQSLCTWDERFEQEILRRISLKGVFEWWQIEQQLQDMHIYDLEIVSNYLQNHMDDEVAVCHCTRILDIEQYKKEGIITGGGHGSIAEIRLRNLLLSIGLGKKEIDEIFSHIYYYWDRDKTSRTQAVHFFIDSSQVYKNDQINHFAVSLGGEILRWAIEDMGKNLYQSEPYKRLLIKGTPCVVKFKCKLSNIEEPDRKFLLAEIVKYSIVTKIFDYSYEFNLTGKTIGSVPSHDIISIEKIHRYVEMKEKHPEYNGFYEELK